MSTGCRSLLCCIVKLHSRCQCQLKSQRIQKEDHGRVALLASESSSFAFAGSVGRILRLPISLIKLYIQSLQIYVRIKTKTPRMIDDHGLQGYNMTLGLSEHVGASATRFCSGTHVYPPTDALAQVPQLQIVECVKQVQRPRGRLKLKPLIQGNKPWLTSLKVYHPSNMDMSKLKRAQQMLISSFKISAELQNNRAPSPVRIQWDVQSKRCLNFEHTCIVYFLHPSKRMCFWFVFHRSCLFWLKPIASYFFD